MPKLESYKMANEKRTWAKLIKASRQSPANESCQLNQIIPDLWILDHFGLVGSDVILDGWVDQVAEDAVEAQVPGLAIAKDGA